MQLNIEHGAKTEKVVKALWSACCLDSIMLYIILCRNTIHSFIDSTAVLSVLFYCCKNLFSDLLHYQVL